jgi:glucose/mannose-6-phosphate isomerase
MCALALEPSDPLSRHGLAVTDRSGLVDDVLAQPDHLRHALHCVDRLALSPHDRPGGLVVCGMGGSAIGADLARAAVGMRARRPMHTVRDYSPDPWLTPDTLVLCASYSGNTEETLAAYATAGAVRADRVVVTTGGALADAAHADHVPVIYIPSGLQPRAAVSYMTAAVLECAYRCGAAPPMRDEIAAAVPLLEQLGREWGPDATGRSVAKALAVALYDYVPVIYGAGATGAVARRWKAQINENAKAPAFSAELPEADHNEICAWQASAASFAAIMLDDGALVPRVERRLQLTAGLVAAAGAPVRHVQARGRTRLERVLSLVFLGDLVSIYLAALYGVDPTPVEEIERFKRALG